jgi:hypothetical protein
MLPRVVTPAHGFPLGEDTMAENGDLNGVWISLARHFAVQLLPATTGLFET